MLDSRSSAKSLSRISALFVELMDDDGLSRCGLSSRWVEPELAATAANDPPPLS